MTSSIAAKIRRTHAEMRKGNPRADDETLLLMAIRAVENEMNARIDRRGCAVCGRRIIGRKAA